jgi:hypothetical protein
MTADSERTVLIERSLWRGFDVLVEPPTQAHPLRHFRDHAPALIHAGQLAALNGWPLLDRAAGHG